MKVKRINILFVVLLMIFACVMPVFAAENEASSVPEQETESIEQPTSSAIESVEDDPVSSEEPEVESTPQPDNTESASEVQEPDSIPTPEPSPIESQEEKAIQVIVPSNGQIIINPYRSKVAIDGVESDAQIIHRFQTLENCGDFPISVSVNAVGTVPSGSEVKFVSAPLSPGMQGKNVFMYVEFQSNCDSWGQAYTGAANQLVVITEGNSKSDVLALDAFGKGYFRLFGEMTDTTIQPWTATDTFGASLVFSFAEAPANPSEEGFLEP